MTTLIVVTSICLQVAAAVWAIRLTRYTGKRIAWFLISVALLLMALRRIIALMVFLSKATLPALEINEVIGLVISILMFIGVISIEGYFRHNQEADREIREREHLFHRLFERGGEGNLLLDNGIFVDCNDRALVMLGMVSAGDLVGHAPASISPPVQPDGQPSDSKARALIERGLTEGSVRFEWMHTRVDGTPCPVDVILTAIPLHGRTLLHTSWRDISARRRAEQALQESLQTSEDIIRSMPSGIFIFQYEAAVDRFFLIGGNGEAERLTGMHVSEIRGKALDEIWHRWYSRPGVRDRVMDVVRSGAMHHVDALEYDDGAVNAIFRFSLFRLPGARLVVAFEDITAQIKDITALRKAEEEIRALNAELEERVRQRTSELEYTNQELEAFTYSISHDLQAPVRAIGGFSQALVERCGGQLPPDGIRYLNYITASAGKMQALIEALLSLSQMGRAPVRRITVDPALLVRDILDVVQPELTGRVVDLQIDPLPLCEADPTLLKQVFHNLLSNAIKFTSRSGHAQIHVGCVGTGSSKVYFVRDNGVGFEPEHAERLFGVFQRLHREEDFKGTGVGLAIAQRIIRRHGGWIWAEAVQGQGATFYFHLHSQPQPVEVAA